MCDRERYYLKRRSQRFRDKAQDFGTAHSRRPDSLPRAVAPIIL
jgi:hypothetical protein